MYTFGLEAISRQSDLFFKELSSCIADAMKKIDRKKDYDNIDEEMKALSAIIKHHTNLRIAPSLGTEIGPAISVPDLTRNSSLRSPVQSYMQGANLQHDLWDADGLIKGRIDYKNNWVDGYYATVPFVMYLPKDIFHKKSNFTPEELAAIILHEVGHAFMYLALLAYTTITTFHMHFIANRWISATPKERELWLIAIARTKGGKDAIDVAEVAKCDDVNVVEVMVISAVNENMRSEIGYSYYEMVAFETMADHYATRCGAGRDLVTALDKLFTTGRILEKRSVGTYIMIEVFKFVVLCFNIPIISSMFRGIATRMVGYDFGSPLYDKPQDRIRRIKMSLIDDLKNENLKVEDKYEIVETIKYIDTILDTTSDRRQWVALVLEKMAFTNTYRQRKGQLFYRELEVLANSDLYVRSAELETLKGNKND